MYFLSWRRKYNLCWAYFAIESMWLSHFRSWEMVVFRNLNDYCSHRAVQSAGGFLLKSTIMGSSDHFTDLDLWVSFSNIRHVTICEKCSPLSALIQVCILVILQTAHPGNFLAGISIQIAQIFHCIDIHQCLCPSHLMYFWSYYQASCITLSLSCQQYG